MESTNKSRISRCREWERNRRNKFNNAITRLGEVVQQINKALDTTCTDDEYTQYPKIEIVEKAIVCLTNCAQEKTKLKAKILALQVQLEAENKRKLDRKDASTQVFISISKKKQNGKCIKLLMLQKSKHAALKSKSCSTSTKSKTQSGPAPNLPILLPKSSLNDKKGPENTIVVLPATPYILPQRPLLFPTVPPAFFLVDPNLQTLSKPSYPLVNRNNGDTTKTTMVNILPISAYSRPLSANKAKKTHIKNKVDVAKKTVKKTRHTKIIKGTDDDMSKNKNNNPCVKQQKETNCDNKEDSKQNPENEIVKPLDARLDKENNTVNNNTEDLATNLKENNKLHTDNQKTKPKENILECLKQQNSTEDKDKPPDFSNISTSVKKTSNIIVNNTHVNNKPSKNPNKESVVEDKENKLTNILDTTLCENNVDGGNARLELAEEFLAASPTAAFLMSFPLVSGNRADSPAEESHSTIQVTSKDNRRNDLTSQNVSYFSKSNDTKTKTSSKSHNLTDNILNKQNEQARCIDSSLISKQIEIKTSSTTMTTTAANVSNENPFLNLPMSSFISTTCALSDSTYGLDIDCSINKSNPTQSTSYVTSSNLFYKSDPFSTVKNTIYSTSSISSGHEFNSFGLYPCAMEKYSTKNKADYANVEDNLMKIGSSRLTYDIDLGWSHKGFDFVSCTSSSTTFNKDNILTTTAGPYSSSYNPFNPEFHVPLTSNSNKKDISSNKSNSYTDTITSFYSQPSNLWSEDIPFYSHNSVSKSLTTKHQNYLPLDHMQTNLKTNISKQYESKHISDSNTSNMLKPSNAAIEQQIVSEKFTKKSPSKMHINWMTSEIRPMQNNCNTELKETPKTTYSHIDNVSKKQDHIEGNYFPLSMHHNFPPQTAQDELQIWPSTRPGGTTEISIEPPPINLPTLVGDLALGPHDKKKNTDIANRGVTQSDIQNCSNFFSVTQLVNRTSDNISTRYEGLNSEASKSNSSKQNITHSTNDTSRKTVTRLDNPLPQPCYGFSDSKTTHYELMNQFSHTKAKTNKPDKNPKIQKNNYSAEALIRGGNCTQKVHDINNTKFVTPSQKYNDFNIPTDGSVAQVSHFPPILDYSDNSYAGQQFSGTTLYNSTTNTISNSFYTNFMPGTSNLMSSNYGSGAFSSDFIDYNQNTECSYTNHKYDDLKMRNNAPIFQQDKVPSNYSKSSRRESTTKHKLDCSKKEPSKKYQNKRVKLTSELEEWPDPAHLLWQNKTPTKRHSSLMSEELPFSNYVGNQMSGQYQPDFFNSHLMPTNMQNVGHNIDRSIASLPVTSRANFNLSTIFPEIAMKVQ